MASIPERLNGHVTLEVACLDRLYLNGYIGPLATSGGLVNFMREQLEKPIPSPAVLGQISEKFRDAVKATAEQQGMPIYQFNHKERKDDVANRLRQQRGVRDGIVFVGVAQEKAQAFQGKKVEGRFQYTRDKTVYVNHYYLLLHRRCGLRPAVHQSMQLRAVGHQALPERTRVGQTSITEAGHRLRSPRQWLPVVRRSQEVAGDL